MISHIQRTACLPYSSKNLYDLVNDVAKYPEFLPWCFSGEVLESTGISMRAKLGIGKSGLKQSFTTYNTLVPEKSIEISLQRGPFQHLHGLWTFDSIDKKECKISLDMSFEYSNLFTKTLLSPFFNKAIDTLVEAFHRRAIELYGKP